MRYDPIKKSVGAIFNRSPLLRRLFYTLLDILLLRSWHVRKQLKAVSPLIPSDSRILDAGAGFGQYTWRMARRNRGWTIDAVDIDETHVKEAGAFFSNTGLSERVSFSYADLTMTVGEPRYNLILSVDVMEHIEEDLLVFQNFNKMLLDGGYLIISTPSDKGGSDAHDHDDDSFIGEHVRNGYSIEDITDKLLAAGFSNIECRYSYGKPGHISWILSMKIPILMAGAFKPLLLLLPFYYLIVMPLAVVLNFADMWLSHREGTGLIVKASKTKR